MKIGFFLRRTVMLACVALLPVMPVHAQQQQMLSIGTGGTGGVYYPLGGGMANILSKKLPGTQATAEVTGASVDNLKFIRSGKMDIGFTMADAAWDAYQGVDKFKDAKVNARTLIALYPNEVQVITIEGTGINKLADLKGKRISTGSPGSGTEVLAFRLLEAAGIDKDKDVKRERLSVAESVNAIKDRKIDAFVWVGGIPTAAVTDLAATPGVKIKLIDHAEVADAMNKKYGPLYTKGTIPAKAYQGQDKASPNIAVWNLLVVDAKMSDDMAYRITRTLMESQPELVNVHQEANRIALKNQGATSPIPYHPGARKYFEEKGIKVQ
jgi:uncharacterized protein